MRPGQVNQDTLGIHLYNFLPKLLCAGINSNLHVKLWWRILHVVIGNLGDNRYHWNYHDDEKLIQISLMNEYGMESMSSADEIGLLLDLDSTHYLSTRIDKNWE